MSDEHKRAPHAATEATPADAAATRADAADEHDGSAAAEAADARERAAADARVGAQADEGAVAQAGGIGEAADERRPLPPTELLRLQPPFEARADGRYHVSEILSFHDRPFVAAAFRAALAREPESAEVSAALADLRAGRRTKLEIVESLIDSVEGRAARAPERIEGLPSRGGLGQRLRALPFVGRLWRVASLVARLPQMARHQQRLEIYTTAQIQRVADHLNLVVEHLNERDLRLADFVNARVSEIGAHVNNVHRDLAGHANNQRQLAADYVNEQRQRIHDYVNEELRPVVADAAEAVSMLSDALASLRAHVEYQQRRINGHEEFLVQEKHEIVEAQKTALAGVEDRLLAAVAAERAGLEAQRAELEAQRRALAEVEARVESLRAQVAATRAAVGEEV